YKFIPAKHEALTSLKVFYPIYKKPIIIQPVIITPLKTYAQYYSFPYALEQGDYNTSVSDLQRILLQEGYFHHSITQYYGPVTSSALKNFALNELGIETSGSVFDYNLIQQVLKKEVK
ncbi:MAG: peptidoglycan-binding protein, partial [Candidatus Gracilibacteria bacterium]|nr:peptidoglycan-binding protein [Candidatus Gracilibacteria bacterium]